MKVINFIDIENKLSAFINGYNDLTNLVLSCTKGQLKCFVYRNQFNNLSNLWNNIDNEMFVNEPYRDIITLIRNIHTNMRWLERPCYRHQASTDETRLWYYRIGERLDDMISFFEFEHKRKLNLPHFNFTEIHYVNGRSDRNIFRL